MDCVAWRMKEEGAIYQNDNISTGTNSVERKLNYFQDNFLKIP